ncbi:MAG: hypothetical protein ACKV2U_15320 [Bryobacteraceae bacterium]
MNRKLFLTASAGALFGASALWGQVIPRPAGELALQLPTGNKIMLSQFKGKGVVLAMMLTT